MNNTAQIAAPLRGIAALADAAELPRSTVHHWARTGTIPAPATPSGRRDLYDAEAFETALAAIDTLKAHGRPFGRKAAK